MVIECKHVWAHISGYLDGTLDQGYAVTPPAAGSLVYPFGTGFVVTGARTTVYR